MYIARSSVPVSYLPVMLSLDLGLGLKASLRPGFRSLAWVLALHVEVLVWVLILRVEVLLTLQGCTIFKATPIANMNILNFSILQFAVHFFDSFNAIMQAYIRDIT